MTIFTKKEELIFLAVYHLGENACLITIRDEIKRFTGRTYSVGTIYAPLSRLEAYGYLEIRKARPHAGPSSKSIQYYRLTSQGRIALADLKRQTERIWKGIDVTAQDIEM
jgi:DNA-binding PadR family transcriptional regulator